MLPFRRLTGLALAGLAACAASPPPPPAPTGARASLDPSSSGTDEMHAAPDAPLPSPRSAEAAGPAAPAPGPAPAPTAASSSPRAARFVALHADVRAHVTPAADPSLPPLAWDPALAEYAQAYANRCPDDHEPDARYGENLFWAGGSFDDTSIEAMAVGTWAAEAEHYDYRTTVCRAGREANWALCGHYTQLVDRRSTRLGCGVRLDCPGEFSAVVVCVYDPPGNVNAEGMFVRRPY